MEQTGFNFDVSKAARRTDPVTSVMAAERVAPHVAGDRMLALRMFYLNQLIALDDFQLAGLTGRRQTSIGKRRGELERMGLVEKAGRRPSPSPLTSSVVQSYKITAAGVAFYLEHSEKR